MKTLLAYASKTGVTEKCARQLAEQLSDTVLSDLTNESPNLDEFDLVILGSGVQGNQSLPAMKKFVVKHKKELLTKKLALFVCCAYFDEIDAILERSFGKELVGQAVIADYFGGEIDLEKLGFWEKSSAKNVLAKVKGRWEIKLLPERLDNFVSQVKTLNPVNK